MCCVWFGLCSCSAQTVGQDFGFLLAGLWSGPSSPDAKLVVAWEHVGWWASADWKWAEICC